MHVCLHCIEFFGFGVYGGFGRATRSIGCELVRQGVKVTVIVPRRSPEYPDQCELEGMTILQFPRHHPWSMISGYRKCKADIYHSQDTSLGTYLARVFVPSSRHVITFQDPLDKEDWKIETKWAHKGGLGWRQYRLYIDNPLVASAVRRAHGLYCAAEFLIPKVVKKYALRSAPGFLPTPVQMPDSVTKAVRPTICFVSRWDGRKRPERFFELARKFPKVEFIAVGGAQNKDRDRHLRETYGGIPNLMMTGIIDQFRSKELSEILGRSWVLVNTSPREGLPNAFLEAAAHRCALLSHADPDGIVSRFGVVAGEDELERGLDSLLADGRWQTLGEQGHEYVSRVFSVEAAMKGHLEAYDRALRGKP